MYRTVMSAAVAFAALAIVGIYLAVSPGTVAGTADAAAAVRSIGASIFGAGLAAFLVVALLSAPASSRR